MKKSTAFMLALALMLSCLAMVSPAVKAAAGEAKLGLGILTDVSGSTAAEADKEGRAKVDTTVVAVLLDADDKIIDVKIDVVQPYTFFDAKGSVTETKSFETKRELGDAYGMRKASAIGKEWFEQASALEAYMIGKTVEEVLATDVDEEHRPTDADLSASVTVHVNTYLAALEKAAANAAAIGSKADDKLGLAIVANNSRSKSVEADADGLAQAYMHVAAVTLNAEGKISAALIDAVQANINFDGEGKITSDLAAEVKTKNELGDDYGMRKASGIGKEWNEQAAAFAAFAVGKDKAALTDLAVEDGKAADEDLKSGVTVTVTDMQAVVVKAIDDASGTAAGEAAEAGEPAKLGLGIVTDISGSTPVEGDKAGRAKVDSTVVAVLLDENNVVLDVAIDVVQPYTSWDASGVVGERKSFESKRELGDAYGMRAASEIGKEWYEQADALEASWICKTADDVLATPVNDESRPTDADLAASVTVHINGYLAAFAEAVDNAAAIGSGSTDKLALAIVADNNRSKDAADDADGLAEAYIHYGAFTFDAEQKVTAAVINAAQARVNFDKAGAITSDLVEDVATKVELGDEYGMRKASAIGKEWYEQAEAFAAYTVGKTADDIKALAVTDGRTTDADLVGSVTITVTALQALVEEAAAQVAAPAETAAGVKTGLAVMTAIGGSTSATAEEAGRAKVDVTAVAVLVDTDGTILDVKIDVVQPYTKWNAEGKLEETKDFMTKRELGDEYGMRAASAIGKEWYEQAAALEDYITGKTLAEVLAMELNEEKRPVDADLAASVTVHVDSYLAALEKAVNTAKAIGASADDALGLGIVANTLRSKDAAEADGLAQAYLHYGAITFNAEGMITSAIIDASQANINFDAKGQLTTDLAVEQKTKLEIGDAYGMRKASAIGKEWNEQAEAYAAYIVGKSLDDVLALSDDAGDVKDTDLLASVTVGIGEMQAVVEKAYQDAFVMAE